MCSNADVAKCLAPGVPAQAKEEFEKLKQHSERLNAGKGSQEKSYQKRETVSGLKRKMEDTDSKLVLPTAAESEESANHVYAWLAAGTNSNFRMLMNITSLGGVNYAFMAADKTARAWLAAENVTKLGFAAKVKARCAGASSASEPVAKRRETVTGTLFDK